MKILLTGGAGYIGSVLVPALLKDKHQVTILDNFLYNQTSLLDVCSDPNLEIIRGDTRNEILIKGALKKADVIIPLACLTGAPICSKDPIAAKTTNLDAIKLILKFKSTNQPIIFPSTQSVYGHQVEICTEETKPYPISLYSKLKVETEKYVSNSKNFIIFRFATVFGISPRMRLDLLVNDFTYRALTDKFIVLFEADFRRDYVYIGDVAQAYLFALKNFANLKGEIYNIKLKDINLTKRQLCQVIQKQIADFIYLESPISEDPDKRDYIVSSKKIEQKGFKATFSIEDGIKELIKGYQIIRKTEYSNNL